MVKAKRCLRYEDKHVETRCKIGTRFDASWKKGGISPGDRCFLPTSGAGQSPLLSGRGESFAIEGGETLTLAQLEWFPKHLRRLGEFSQGIGRLRPSLPACGNQELCFLFILSLVTEVIQVNTFTSQYVKAELAGQSTRQISKEAKEISQVVHKASQPRKEV